jgi:hypothetical protein
MKNLWMLDLSSARWHAFSCPMKSAKARKGCWIYRGKSGLSACSIRQLLQRSQFIPGLTPVVLTVTLEQSKSEGQTTALSTFRTSWKKA